jgi:hypothetical protein
MPSWDDFQQSPHYPLVVSHDPQAKGQVGRAAAALQQTCWLGSLKISSLQQLQPCGSIAKGGSVQAAQGETSTALQRRLRMQQQLLITTTQAQLSLHLCIILIPMGILISPTIATT